MKIIGLTGGVGCGKTTVLAVFRTLGVPCLMADEVAGRYYNDSVFLSSIRNLFGQRVFRPDGSADKRAIADIVFADPDVLQQLNALVHPRVMTDLRHWADQQTAEYVIFESAILYESGFDKIVDKVVAVYLEKEERMRRLELRDHASRDALEARMRNQHSAEEKMDHADYVILNYEGNPRRRQVEYIDQMLRGKKKSLIP